ncbi:pyochelin biosynthetic protein PchC [Cellvibrio japonicus Ueda107]|uniref:Pyochelin biosynthetic protein PchC n=2 Tax=Cellvibrio japonicus TaxID=155077 RepID=B3PCT6_CELJU|nr:thioesterase domain-containing protein [Cellvibrio japonicus]ACE82862.1 pyochelin biosynthetic protein PchC [Cellvibrio japonicus Ueda107]
MSRWGSFSPATDAVSVRLFCLPHAGGGSSLYRSWVRFFSSEVYLSAALLAGREGRFNEPCATNIQDITAPLVRDIVLQKITVPIVLFGHSMGSILAYDIAQRLESEGIHVAALCVSGRLPPHIVYGGDMHRLSDNEFLQRLKRLGGIHDVLLEEPEILRQFLPSMRCDYQVLESYRTAPIQLNSPIIICDGENDSETNMVEMLRWQDLTRQPIFYQRFPGGHFYVREQGCAIATYLQNCFTQLSLLERSSLPLDYSAVP